MAHHAGRGRSRPARGSSVRAWLLVASAALVAGGWTGVSAQTPSGDPATRATGTHDGCPTGVVGRIDIRNNSLFAPEDIQGRTFSWALSLANWLHVRTRTGYLRNELLLHEGDCYDAEALAESLRLLREAPFIARVDAQPRERADSTWIIHLETWDEWTTQVGVNFAVEDAFQFKGVNLTEKNFLGRGLTASIRYHRFREREDRSLTLGTPRVLGTRTDASVSAGTTRTGSYFRQDISYPFVGEAGHLSFKSRLQYEDHEYSYVTGPQAGITHVLLPLTDRSATGTFAHRVGKPGALTLVGGEVQILRRTVTGDIRQVVGGNYEGASPAADTLAAALGGQANPDSYVRLGASVGVRRLHFVTRDRLDLVSGVQDVAVGDELTFTVGRTLGTWGTASHDTYGRLDGFAGGTRGPLVGNVAIRAEGRHVDAAPADRSAWRDMLVNGTATAYLRSPTSRNTVVGGARFDIRWNIDQPYQTVLGGPEGVRSYRDTEVPAASTLVTYLEEHLDVPWLQPAVDLGFTLFGDLGRGWGNGVPFAVDTGWRRAVGAGIRIGFPAGTGSVTRAEIAWPVGGPDAGRSPVFRAYWSRVTTSR